MINNLSGGLMKVYLEFTDLELEFLEKFGIHLVANYFYTETDNGKKDKFICTGSKYGPIKESPAYSLCTHEFKSKRDGSIIFVRTADGKPACPSVYVRYNGISLGIGESSAHKDILSNSENLSGYNDIIKDIKCLIAEAITWKFGSKFETFISIVPTINNNDLSYTKIYADKENVGTITGKMSGVTGILGNSKELIKGNYILLFDEAIKEIFEPDQRLVSFYSKYVKDLFARVFDATLYIPAIREQQYREHYYKARQQAEDNYQATKAQAAFDKSQAIKQIDNDEEDLNNVIGQYYIDSEKQK